MNLIGGREAEANEPEWVLSVSFQVLDFNEGVLSRCASTAMVVEDGREAAPGSSSKAPAAGGADALRRWDTNGNGRITCREARAHDIAPVRRGHPAYPFMRDGDGDGVVCE